MVFQIQGLEASLVTAPKIGRRAASLTWEGGFAVLPEASQQAGHVHKAKQEGAAIGKDKAVHLHSICSTPSQAQIHGWTHVRIMERVKNSGSIKTQSSLHVQETL